MDPPGCLESYPEFASQVVPSFFLLVFFATSGGGGRVLFSFSEFLEDSLRAAAGQIQGERRSGRRSGQGVWRRRWGRHFKGSAETKQS